jgi:hypothetical protein
MAATAGSPRTAAAAASAPRTDLSQPLGLRAKR